MGVGAWGYNQYGEVGNGSTTSQLVPARVSQLTNVTSIAGGYEAAYALRQDGTVWAWGNDWYGQLGDGNTLTAKATPMQFSDSLRNTGC